MNDESSSFGTVLLKEEEANFLKRVHKEKQNLELESSLDSFYKLLENIDGLKNDKKIPENLDFEKFWMLFSSQFVFPKLEDIVDSNTKQKYESSTRLKLDIDEAEHLKPATNF